MTSGTSKQSIFNKSYRIWGHWDVGEKCVQGLSALMGLIQGGADLWGDKKFYSGSVEIPSKQLVITVQKSGKHHCESIDLNVLSKTKPQG